MQAFAYRFEPPSTVPARRRTILDVPNSHEFPQLSHQQSVATEFSEYNGDWFWVNCGFTLTNCFCLS
jgi:hypothetical protein